MAQAKIFSFKEAVKTGWDIVKKNFLFFLMAMIILGLLSSLGNIIPGDLVKNYPSLGFAKFALAIVGAFFSILINMGIIKAIFMLLDGQSPKPKDLFLLSDRVINMFLASLLYGLIVLGGFILLIVPGIIWCLKFSQYKYFIVEKNAGPVEALKLSAQATAGAKWKLFLFSFVCLGINIVGLLCLGIGLLFTAPLTMVAMAFIYRKLRDQMAAVPAPTVQ